MRLTLAGREIELRWYALLIYLLLVSGLLRLGFWQLDRSEQKRQFLDQQQQAIHAPPLDLQQQPGLRLADAEYRQVRVSGHYDADHQLLIDNQIQEGKPGYLVLTPFIIGDHIGAVLVNRGWVPLNADRRILPDVSIQQPETTISGRIHHFPEPGIKLAGGEQPGSQWPAVIQYVQTTTLAQSLGYALSDFEIELDADQQQGYQRHWQISSTISPEKHVGYAVQWFGLAATLSVLFIWLTLKKSL